jgi:DNA-binding CsgD family transcriptional regulator
VKAESREQATTLRVAKGYSESSLSSMLNIKVHTVVAECSIRHLLPR